MVVDPAVGHLFQGEQGHLACVVIAGPVRLAQQEAQGPRVRKFGRAAEPAMPGIELAGQLAQLLRRSGCRPVLAFAAAGLQLRKGAAQRGVLFNDGLSLLAIRILDLAQQVAKGGQTVAWLRREIGAGKEGAVVIRGQKDGQRPAARTACQQLVCGLIDLVEVRPLFAVDLDVDEQPFISSAVAGSSKDSCAIT